MLAMQYQLEQSQWWPADALRTHQFRQLGVLIRHAYETIPFYRERFNAAELNPNAELSPEIFSRLPLLQRRQVQIAGEALLSQKLLQEHGKVHEGQTSGSTGRPLSYFGTQYSQFIWQALTLREHLWHKRNFQGKLAVIRISTKKNVLKSWGPPADLVFETGPAAALDIKTPIDMQAKWLHEQDPDYLLSYPSNILGLANHCIEKGIKLNKLREVRTLGEAFNPELRAICHQAWGVPVVDMYSAQEAGYIALQCPDHEYYHVQSEAVLVEILNEDGSPCKPGEIGKLVVTTLHNYAMPLIRYEIGDYAEVGEHCSCGRGLPVIKRILGRQRNLIILPDGKKHWPSMGYSKWMGIAPIEQIQLVQKTLHQVEVRLVMPRPLTPDERRRMIPILQESLGYAFQISFSYHDEICRSSSGKFEDFISEVGTSTGRQPGEPL